MYFDQLLGAVHTRRLVETHNCIISLFYYYYYLAFTFLQIFDLRLQTFADIGKNQYFQTYKYANIRSYRHLYVGCKLLLGPAYA